MASAERKLSVEKAKKDAMNESVAASDTQAETDMFQCNNCKKRRCKYFQMQTRSSDEPMTTFVSCLNCGKRWKVVDPLPFLKLNPIATNPLQFC